MKEKKEEEKEGEGKEEEERQDDLFEVFGRYKGIGKGDLGEAQLYPILQIYVLS